MKFDQFVKKAPSAPSAAAAAPAAPASSGPAFKSDVVFPEIQKNLDSDPAIAGRVNGIYVFEILSGGGSKQWTVDLKTAPGKVSQGKHPKPDVTIAIADADLMGLVSGSLNGQQLFMQGKLKITGNMAFAMKLDQLFKKQAKL